MHINDSHIKLENVIHTIHATHKQLSRQDKKEYLAKLRKSLTSILSNSLRDSALKHSGVDKVSALTMAKQSKLANLLASVPDTVERFIQSGTGGIKKGRATVIQGFTKRLTFPMSSGKKCHSFHRERKSKAHLESVLSDIDSVIIMSACVKQLESDYTPKSIYVYRKQKDDKQLSALAVALDKGLSLDHKRKMEQQEAVMYQSELDQMFNKSR